MLLLTTVQCTICYVLLVLWIDFIFSHNVANGAESKTVLSFVNFARWRHKRRSLMPTITLFSDTKNVMNSSEVTCKGGAKYTRFRKISYF